MYILIFVSLWICHSLQALDNYLFDIFTPHAQRERGKVIGRGVHIYIYIYIYMSVVKKKI